jgi:DNA repair protein RadC
MQGVTIGKRKYDIILHMGENRTRADRGIVAFSSIREWPREERPREILFDKGIESVSDAGLLAILLQSGIHGKDAVALARELLASYRGLRGLFRESPGNLMRAKDLGRAKIARLLAAVEVARRSRSEEIVGVDYFDSGRDVLDVIKSSMKDCTSEQLRAIFLDKSGHILSFRVLCEGTIDRTAVYPREVIKAALDIGASGAVFIHNHPAGSLEPSEGDRETARILSAACRSVDISPVDHLIVGDNSLISITI